MKKSLLSLAALVALLVTMVEARTPSDIKNDLAGIMPPDKKARFAYNKGGKFAEFPFYAWNTAIYVVDSDDGIIRRLYPIKDSTGVFHHICITADGSRVIFYNNTSGRLGVINWDGTNYREVDIGGKHCDYWRDPKDGSDWSLYEVTFGGMWRINIDTRAKVQLTSAGYGMSGFTMSDDGKMAVVNPGNIFGIQSIPMGSVASSGHGGCWGNLGPGPNPQFNHNPPAAHHVMCLHDAANPTKFVQINTSELCQAFLKTRGQVGTCGEVATNEGVRFTNHPDYVTFMAGKSTANPIMMRISDRKFFYMEENLPCTFCGDMDVVFLNKGTNIIHTERAAAPLRLLRSDLADMYSFDGRYIASTGLNKQKLQRPGIAIVKGGRAVSMRLLALTDRQEE